MTGNAVEQELHCPVTSVQEPDWDVDELTPLLGYLRSNALPIDAMTFPRGTVLPDGRLDLCKQDLGPTRCRMVVQAASANSRVKSIMLGTDGIGDQGAVEVAGLIDKNPGISVVYLGCNFIGPAGSTAVAEAIGRTSSVSGLWLKRNPIGRDGARALARMLRRNTTLRVLDVEHTHIGLDGLAEIVDAVVDGNTTIERLHLGANDWDPEAAAFVARLITGRPGIKALSLNTGRLGDDGALLIADALTVNDTLSELSLSSNGIGSIGGVRLLEVVKRHPSLKRLNLGYSRSTHVLNAERNRLGDPGASAADDVIRHNSTLLSLDLKGNGISSDGIDVIVKALESNNTLQRLVVQHPSDERIVRLLQRNQAHNEAPDRPSEPDLELVRSVYRTVKPARHH